MRGITLVIDAVNIVLRHLGEQPDGAEARELMAAENVEVVSTWPGVTFETVFGSSAPQRRSRGLRVAALEHVLAFKAISTREKD